jgi:two-component system cell cycle sensor histidine kinase/response regulator CckA
VVCRNIATDPQFAPWREDAMARGYASSVAIPICDGDRCLGALNLYAAEPDAFDDDEVALLEELGIDLMLGLVRLRGVRTLQELQVRLELAANANETTIAKATAVAHDLANLLQVISTAIDAAQLSPEPGSRDDALAEAMRAAVSAGSMLRQIVSLTRRAQDSSERSMVDHVAGSLRHLFARLAPGATVKLELGAHGIAARLAALSLERILINLVVNAGHALEGGGTITITTGHRRVPSEGLRLASGLLPGGDYVELVVADSGTGIAPDVLPRVFEPYFTTKGDAGTGLGLPSVLSMVRAAGGGVDVASVVGEGTRFTVLVPLVVVPS